MEVYNKKKVEFFLNIKIELGVDFERKDFLWFKGDMDENEMLIRDMFFCVFCSLDRSESVNLCIFLMFDMCYLLYLDFLKCLYFFNMEGLFDFLKWVCLDDFFLDYFCDGVIDLLNIFYSRYRIYKGKENKDYVEIESLVL